MFCCFPSHQPRSCQCRTSHSPVTVAVGTERPLVQVMLGALRVKPEFSSSRVLARASVLGPGVCARPGGLCSARGSVSGPGVCSARGSVLSPGVCARPRGLCSARGSVFGPGVCVRPGGLCSARGSVFGPGACVRPGGLCSAWESGPPCPNRIIEPTRRVSRRDACRVARVSRAAKSDTSGHCLGNATTAR